MAKDRFGYGREENVSDLESIWTEFTDKNIIVPKYFIDFKKLILKIK